LAGSFSVLAGLADGMMQTVVPIHLLAIVAVGLLGGQGGRSGFVLVLFAIGMLAGALVIASAMRETPSALVLLAMAAFAGIAVATAIVLPSILTNVLAFATGAALALDAPPQAVGIPAAIATQVGFGGAALTTLGLIAFTAMRADRPWQRIGVRIAGSWIAASAILVLALRLTR
jgi:urease accessory protein